MEETISHPVQYEKDNVPGKPMILRVYLDRDLTRQTPGEKRTENGKEDRWSETGNGRSRSRICRQARARSVSLGRIQRGHTEVGLQSMRDSPLYQDRAMV